MHQIRQGKHTDAIPGFAKPILDFRATENRQTQHPERFAIEQLKLGDENYFQNDYLAAKANYISAVKTLECLPFSNQDSLKQGFKRLAIVHLRLFEFKDSFSCFVKARQICQSKSRDRIAAESDAIMAKIMAARTQSKNSDSEGYSPGFYTSHL
ncbi:MAG: hypothetical protein K2X81_07660 [Candidatus Obscuribacterales bacterium]|nr:hypothetical protein [Candidatus Obscuribacterales bacterium]